MAPMTDSVGGTCMISLEQRVHPHPEVVDTEIEARETALLHLDFYWGAGRSLPFLQAKNGA